MKRRYGVLFSLTLLLIAGIWAGGNYFKGQAVYAPVITLETVSEENTVTCTGIVENSKQKKVYTKANAVPQEIYVEEGQRVEKGDVLMSVKVPGRPADGTASSSAGSSSSATSSIPDLTDLSGLDAATAQQVYQQYLSGNTASSSSQPASNEVQASADAEDEVLEVVAPVSGVISTLNSSTDQSKAPVAVIAENEGLQINLSVNESQISGIEVGQKAVISGVGFSGNTYQGTVTSISNIAKQKVSATSQETVVNVIVTVDYENNGDTSLMKSGFTAKCKIIKSVDENQLIVPYEAVLAEDDGREYVYKVIENKAAKAYIKTGREFENGFAVTEGLAAGDEVVTTPERVRETQTILRMNQGVVNDYAG